MPAKNSLSRPPFESGLVSFFVISAHNISILRSNRFFCRHALSKFSYFDPSHDKILTERLFHFYLSSSILFSIYCAQIHHHISNFCFTFPIQAVLILSEDWISQGSQDEQATTNKDIRRWTRNWIYFIVWRKLQIS